MALLILRQMAVAKRTIAIVCCVLTILSCDNSNQSLDTSAADQAWTTHELQIEHKLHQIKVRVYNEPLPIKIAISTDVSEETALAVQVQTWKLGSQISNRIDFEGMSLLFDNPAKAMTEYEELAASSGGWDAYSEKVATAVQKEVAEAKILGEFILEQYHVFVMTRPQIDTYFNVLVEVDEGAYLHVKDWDFNLATLYMDQEFLDLFQTD